MRRKLQIDVKGTAENNDNIIECCLIFDGRSCIFYLSKANYEALMYDGLFIRDGKSRDSANIINTTNLFEEL
ncbi:hypothetical protein DBR40_24800 [Pedobacter sp. KBW01]|uniref:hypothetical protein n=1 Tax=Pedobacter sp. KBW01 TaxID=2153364 RepID=UPI000F5926D2|nr:hypothetical protein [Pedobacter sp. KBW01]RQO65094.1 hypothetical protein DBR40_24800 [Pedobacter sp. KBW01]